MDVSLTVTNFSLRLVVALAHLLRWALAIVSIRLSLASARLCLDSNGRSASILIASVLLQLLSDRPNGALEALGLDIAELAGGLVGVELRV